MMGFKRLGKQIALKPKPTSLILKDIQVFKYPQPSLFIVKALTIH